MSAQNILFFSERCPYSKKVISQIINTPLYHQINRVCVDSAQVRQRLPNFVIQTNKIPLIYLAQPSHKYGQLLYENNMWNWLDEQLRLTQTNATTSFQQPHPSDQPQPRRPVHNPTGQQGPPPPEPGNTTNTPAPIGDSGSGFLAYNPLEMGGGISSDMYSPFNKVDSPPTQQPLYPHSYENVGGPGGAQISQGNPPNPQNLVQPQNNNQGQNSRSAQRQDKFEQDLASIKAMRDQEPYAQNIKPVMGTPQNFEQQWNQKNSGAPSYVQ